MIDKEKQLAAAFQAIEAAKLSEIASGNTLSGYLIDGLLKIAVESIDVRRYETHARYAEDEATFLAATHHRNTAAWEWARLVDKVLTSFPEGIKRQELSPCK